MWPFKVAPKVAPPHWSDDYKVGDTFQYLGLYLVMCSFDTDIDIGCIGIVCDYVDRNGILRQAAFDVGELGNLKRVIT